MIAPWWPGQIRFTLLLTGSNRYVFLRKSIQILNPSKEITTSKDISLSRKIAAFLVDLESNSGEKYQYNFKQCEQARVTQQIIEGQQFNTLKKYISTMGVIDDMMIELNHTIEDIIIKKISKCYIEFIILLMRTKKTQPSSAKHAEQILNTLLSLIFGTVQASTTAQRLITHVISNCRINNPRYGST
ncbi:MAG: hypothetical protein EZS28_001689 [Streblomastix strix]|uniref:Uncharacterized protein n=1 Tax=Streblomastix strix TaxID=222440 RepID=A0A5J4X8C5_9EUKA|nr:MAG: hypothetical protein EZS28_001689 [Streblomastix strix]